MQLNRIKLDQRNEQLWDQTRAALSIVGPQFTHLIYTLLDNSGSKHHAIFTDNPEVPTAATDAVNIILNPGGFFPRSLGERVFIVGHEVMHNVFNDVVYLHYCAATGHVITSAGNRLPFVAQLMQVAMDLRINDCLVECKFGDLPPDGWWDRGFASHKDTVADIYEKLFKACQNSGGKSKGGKGGTIAVGRGKSSTPTPVDGTGGGMDNILSPGATKGQTPTEGAQERDNQQGQWELEIKAAMALARTQGRLPGALAHHFGQITEHKVPWNEHMEAELARAFGGGSSNWKRPDRRFIVRDIYVPGRASFACDHLVVATDTSGSIRPDEIDMSLRETAAMLDLLKPERITWMWIDAAIHRIDEVRDANDIEVVKQLGAPGRGGTDFRPVFDHIEKEGWEPDCLVYFTDGYGTFPSIEPAYPVIWGAFFLAGVNYPFGKVIEIPRD